MLPRRSAEEALLSTQYSINLLRRPTHLVHGHVHEGAMLLHVPGKLLSMSATAATAAAASLPPHGARSILERGVPIPVQLPDPRLRGRHPVLGVAVPLVEEHAHGPQRVEHLHHSLDAVHRVVV